jgi:flagellar biosynthesis protein FliR
MHAWAEAYVLDQDFLFLFVFFDATNEITFMKLCMYSYSQKSVFSTILESQTFQTLTKFSQKYNNVSQIK